MMLRGVKTFKIDVRILYKIEGQKFELVNDEISRYRRYDKIIDDSGKLPREGKDIMDS